MNLRKLPSFTLIEVLLVAALIATLSLAIFKSFGNGLNLWARAQGLNKETEMAIFMDRLAEDLRSVPLISGISFKGRFTELSFPAIVYVKVDTKSSRASEEMIDQIGAIQYRFEPGAGVIYRRQANYSQALKNKWPLQENIIASNIDHLNLRYISYSNKNEIVKTEMDELPRAILVEVQYHDEVGPHQMKRFLSIPVNPKR